MAISLSSLKRVETLKPPRILLYGVEGIGKSTFGAAAPNPVFIMTEDGAPKDSVTFPLAKSYQEVIEAIYSLYQEEHDFKTVVVDSIDWLEPLIWAHTCKINNWKDGIEQPGYGKGYAAALDVWREYIDALNRLRDDRNMSIIQIAHSDVKRYDSPETEPYDRYQIKLQAKASALMQEHSDAIFFANYRVGTTKADVGFKKTVTRAVGSGERVLYTTARPAFIAKNRYDMPDTIPLTWEAAAEHMPVPA